jgi:hypothetical protein
MGKITSCPECSHKVGIVDKPIMKRDPENPLVAVCPSCGLHMANGDGHIGFRGRPLKKKEPDAGQQ